MITNYQELKKDKKAVKKNLRRLKIDRAINSISSDAEVISFAGLLIGSTIVPTDPTAGAVLIGVSSFSVLECAKIGKQVYYANAFIKAQENVLQEVQEHIDVHEEVYRERRQNMKNLAKEEKKKIKRIMKNNK